jgi:hypothetical protein
MYRKQVFKTFYCKALPAYAQVPNFSTTGMTKGLSIEKTYEQLLITQQSHNVQVFYIGQGCFMQAPLVKLHDPPTDNFIPHSS